MPTFTLVLIILTAIVVALTIVFYFLGKRAEKKRAEQDEQVKAMAQTVSMLVIDKKRMKITEAGLPEAIVNSMPWYAKGSKMPIVKAKVGPKVMTFICDYEIFDQVPVKKEVKATVSGLYITGVKGLHGKNTTDQTTQKKGLRAWFQKQAKKLNQA
ncbi:MAG: hypothetical protein K6B14_01785 [Lachnospiraceae bacterium]|nr:hypothetical protein [Lachnospiraceae bacterium]